MASLSPRALAGAAALVVVAAGATAGGIALTGDGGTSVTAPAPPAPLVNVLAVGPDFVQLDWGPQQPGPMSPSAITARSLVVNWGASKDTLHPSGLTYTLSKNGIVIARGLTNTWSKVGFTTKVRRFRTCVVAINSTGKSSSPMCATWTAP